MNGTCGNPGFVVMAAQALNPVDVHKSLSSKYEDGYRCVPHLPDFFTLPCHFILP